MKVYSAKAMMNKLTEISTFLFLTEDAEEMT